LVGQAILPVQELYQTDSDKYTRTEEKIKKNNLQNLLVLFSTLPLFISLTYIFSTFTDYPLPLVHSTSLLITHTHTQIYLSAFSQKKLINLSSQFFYSLPIPPYFLVRRRTPLQPSSANYRYYRSAYCSFVTCLRTLVKVKFTHVSVKKLEKKLGQILAELIAKSIRTRITLGQYGRI